MIEEISDADPAEDRPAVGRVIRRDLSDMAGTWHPDADFDAAIADQHRVDES
jgi:hypothetical protein